MREKGSGDGWGGIDSVDGGGGVVVDEVEDAVLVEGEGEGLEVEVEVEARFESG